jgi:hypothetical protein
MRNTSLMKWLVVAAALAQIFGSWWPAGAGIGQNVGERSAMVTTPATPGGYAFAIWGLIFAAAVAFAVYQLLTRDEDDVRAVRAPFALACAANAAWEIYVQFRGIDLVSVVIIAIGLASALSALLAAGKIAAPRLSRRSLLVLGPTGLTAGWLGVAAFANAAAVLKGAGATASGSEALLAGVLIAAAALLAAVVALRSPGRFWYGAAAAWGLAAVVVRNMGPGGSGMVATVAGAGVAVVALAVVVGELRHKRRAGPASGSPQA